MDGCLDFVLIDLEGHFPSDADSSLALLDVLLDQSLLQVMKVVVGTLCE